MHPTPILATFSNISGRPKDIKVGCKGVFITRTYFRVGSEI